MAKRNIMLDTSTTSIVIDLLVQDEKYCECLKGLPSFPSQEPTTKETFGNINRLVHHITCQYANMICLLNEQY
ncbi:hypothetical protein ACOSP7_004476 [Xanthoceras sorbifolium]